ncbi:MAG: hypothetical protein FWD15_05680 [Alphaproteobacteria bacterium]|nr:hypothetical protein [Alphaproteobacteria bacterium]
MIKVIIFLALVILSYFRHGVKPSTGPRSQAAETAKSAPPLPPPAPPKPTLEQHFPLRKIDSPYFINDLVYNHDNNFLKHPFYHKFGIDACYVHKDLMPMMIKLEQELYEKNLRAIVFDCFRPQEVQEYMWSFNPNPKFVMDPKIGSMHSRGLAIDIGLADKHGVKIEKATEVDSFTKSASHDYKCKPHEIEKCEARQLLKDIMERSGFRALRHEWWHYELPGRGAGYPTIRVCGHIECEK